MRLLHYSTAPLTEVHHAGAQGQEFGPKPQGLWVSVEGEDDWEAWCTAESFRTDCLAVATEVVLHPDARVLHLATASAVCAFGKKHAVEKRMPMSNYELDWPSVAKDYQGIIIAPYQWSIRLDRAVFWYYGWDCASGCIWDASAVERLVAHESMKQRERTHG